MSRSSSAGLAGSSRGALDTARLLLQLMRFDRPLCAGLLTGLGAYLSGPTQALWSPRVFVAACVVALITAFGFVINDYCDLAVDSLGKPGRPLPSGQISAHEARRFAWSLAAAGLLLGAALGARGALFAAGAVALSAAYSYRLKSTLLIGNASVALLVAAVIVFGADVAGSITPAVVAAACITFTYITAQEVLFNLEDEPEDRAAGLRTTATRLGPKRTARLLRGLLWAVMPVAVAPWALQIGSVAYIAALGVFTLLPVAALLHMLRSSESAATVHLVARWSRLVWLTSFIPLALLK